MKKKALLIGVNEYQAGFSSLSSPVKNVTELKKVLEDSGIGGFVVNELCNPSTQKMREAIDGLFSSSSKEDLILLFFSGHGVTDNRGNLFFATSDTVFNEKRELQKSTAVSAKTVSQWMVESYSKRQVLILDCCYSGAFARNVVPMGNKSINIPKQFEKDDPVGPYKRPLNQPRVKKEDPSKKLGRAILTSSDSYEYSFETKDAELSVYTRYLIEGLQTGIADSDGDSDISTCGLHEYAKRRVREEQPSMTPQFFSSREGYAIPIAKSKPTAPELLYRRAVAKYAKRGKISEIAHTNLENIRVDHGLSEKEAQEIRVEVLQPYQIRLENIANYHQIFVETIKKRIYIPFLLGKEDLEDLQDLQDRLKLRNKDIGPVWWKYRSISSVALVLLVSSSVAMSKVIYDWVNDGTKISDVGNVPNTKQPFKYGGSSTWVPVQCKEDSTDETGQGIDRLIQKEHPGFILHSSATKSRDGIRRLIEGEFDFIISSDEVRPDDQQAAEEAGKPNIQQIPVTKDAIAFAVNSTAPTDGLTIENLQNIYGSTSRKSWDKVLGGEYEGLEDRKVIPFSRSREESGTVQYFVDALNINSQTFDSAIELVPSTYGKQGGLEKVRKFKDGIYFTTSTEIFGEVGIVPISIGYQANNVSLPYQDINFTPGCDNMHKNSSPLAKLATNYPKELVRQIYVTFLDDTPNDSSDDNDSIRAAKKYAEMLRTNEGQKYLQQIGYFPY